MSEGDRAGQVWSSPSGEIVLVLSTRRTWVSIHQCLVLTPAQGPRFTHWTEAVSWDGDPRIARLL